MRSSRSGRRPFSSLAIAALISLLSVSACRDSEVSAGSDAPPPIEIKATLTPAQAMTITSQIDGQVDSVAAISGGSIAANAELVRLSNPSVERDAAIATTQRDWIDVRARRSGRKPQTATAPRESIEIAAKILELRRQRFDSMKALRKSRDITTRELEQAEIEYLAALRDYNNERRVLAGAPAPPGDGELLAIERRKAEADAKFAVQRQSQLRIVSPIAGTITRLYVTPGQSVFPRDPIADVANLSTVHVRGEVAPELVRYLKAGAAVDVKILSVPPRTFADEIEYIMPAQPGATGARPAVIVSIPNPDGSLQPNTPALITLRSIR
jgi:multidrug resistance efflux pump